MSLKHFFLLLPLLWIRKVILWFLVVSVLLGLLLYVAANSPWLVRKAAEHFAPAYHISYSRIDGNPLTGIEIEDITYKQKPVAKHIALQWNPNALLHKEIKVDHVRIEALDVKSVEEMIADFGGKEESSSESFDFSIRLQRASVDLLPFERFGVAFDKVALDATDILYASDRLALGKTVLEVDSNITNIHASVALKKGVVEVERLDVQALDIKALKALAAQVGSDAGSLQEDNASSKRVAFMPTAVHLKSLSLDIAPVVYEPLKIESATVNAKGLLFDIEKMLLEEGRVTLEAESNVAKLMHRGKIEQNALQGEIKIIPTEYLFSRYDLPLSKDAIGSIDVKLDANKERLVAQIDKKIEALLKAESEHLNVDIERLQSTIRYEIGTSILHAKTDINLSSPYAKKVTISNSVEVSEDISYHGKVYIPFISGVEAKFVKPLENLSLSYKGNTQSIESQIDSKMFEGTFSSQDFKSAQLHLLSKGNIKLAEFVSLPKELNASEASIVVDVPLHFEQNGSYEGEVKIVSNLADIDANVSYGDVLHLKALVDAKEESLLRAYNKDIKWDALMPLGIDATLLQNNLKVSLQAKKLHIKADYDLHTTAVKGQINMGSMQADIEGIAQKEIVFHSTVTTLSSLMQSLSDIYNLGSIPKIEGSAKLSMVLKELKEANLVLHAPEVRYHTDYKNITSITDIDLHLYYQDGELLLQKYNLVYEKEKIFATKPSTVTYKESQLTLKPLWVNDALKAEGTYSIETQEGNITLKAKSLPIVHEWVDMHTAVDLLAKRDGNSTHIKGEVTLLGGNILYDISQKRFASDSDIVIVQEMKKEKETPFMEMLRVGLSVKSKKPLVYKKGDIDLQAHADLSMHKVEHGELLVLGSVTLLEGGSYMFQGKKFVLDESFVYFTGNPSKPLLDIKVKYKALNHLVTIAIRGSADLPDISFSSKPSLTKEQILSLILFDTEAGAGTNSGDEMMKMMGGAMAKSALNNMGIKIDHLVLGAGNSVEVGKKISDNITIIYVNDTVSEVKLKYRHSEHLESVIGASEKSESYDMIYKIDF